MLDKLFIGLLNMSYVASFVIIFVLIARFLMQKNVPKKFIYILWLPVLFKLICPFSFESLIGLMPQKTTPISQHIIYDIKPQIDTGFNIIDSTVNAVLPASPNIGNSINPIQIWLFIAEIIWLTGIAVMLVYSLVSLVKLLLKLKISVHLTENIYMADHISSPFVIGFIKPKIYLPSNLSENEMEYIILHEKIHIKRLDHITRLLAFVLLSMHWFNPLVWLAFILSNKDMEMSCDEMVMDKFNGKIKTDYSNSLLSFAVSKNIIHPTPLAFGESATKGRVKNILKYKKASKISAIVIVVILAVFSVFLISKNTDSSKNPHIELTNSFLSTMFSGDNSEIDKIFDPLKADDFAKNMEKNTELFEKNSQTLLENYANKNFISDYQRMVLELSALHRDMNFYGFTTQFTNTSVTLAENGQDINYSANAVLKNDEKSETMEVKGTIQFDEENKISYFRISGLNSNSFVNVKKEDQVDKADDKPEDTPVTSDISKDDWLSLVCGEHFLIKNFSGDVNNYDEQLKNVDEIDIGSGGVVSQRLYDDNIYLIYVIEGSGFEDNDTSTDKEYLRGITVLDGEFCGTNIKKDTIDEVISILGEPTSHGAFEDGDGHAYTYYYQYDLTRMYIFTDKEGGVIEEVNFILEKPIV